MINKKTILIILSLILIAGVVLFLRGEQPPENVQRANVIDSAADNNVFENIKGEQSDFVKADEINVMSLNKVDFKFTGFGPGKSHDGTFSEIKIQDNKVVFSSNTVNTEIEKLNEHLCAAEFLDCDNYKEILFQATEISTGENGIVKISGDLLFKGVQKQITFDLQKIDDKKEYFADFLLDTSEFGISVPVAEKDVRIQFTLSN
jgi:polyisoprenoid-binding protein YceI